MKRLLFVALLTTLAVGTYPALATLWDAAGYEADPADSDPVSQGDDQIREQKKESRFRLEVEHHFGDDNSDDNGSHRIGSARCFVQGTAPTVTQRADYNANIGTSGSGSATLTSNAALNTDVPVLKVGHGRCWLDSNGADNVEGTSDDNAMWVFDQDPNGDANTADAGWVLASVAVMSRGHISGLNTNHTGTNVVSIAVGEARTGTSANRSLHNAVLAAAISKDLDLPWASSTAGGGGRASTVGLAANTWYHYFLLNCGSSVNAGFDTSLEAAGLLADANVIAAGCTQSYRRIWSVKTDGANLIRSYVQQGDNGVWASPPGLDVSLVAQDFTSDTNVTLANVPPDIVVEARVRAFAINLSTSRGMLRSGSTTIGANPEVNTSPMANISTTGGAGGSSLTLLTNVSRQLVYRVMTDTSSDLYVETEGWTDWRGRWD